MLTAKDVMRKQLITLFPEMTLGEAAELFSRKGITGAPVVSPEGRLLGMLSRTDLAGRGRANDTAVKHAMTPWVVTLEEDVPVREVARQMLAKRIHRVVITRDGEPRGIVTSMDMLRALLKSA